MPTATITPVAVRRSVTMHRIRATVVPDTAPAAAHAASMRAQVLAGRRRAAAKNGYRGPLTREELAAQARDFAARTAR